MTDIDTAALRMAAEGATPGPWEAEHRGFDVYETHSQHGDVVAEAGLSPRDAAYIAAASPDVVLALLDRLKAAEAKLAAVEALADEWDSHVNWRAWGVGSAIRHALVQAQVEADIANYGEPVERETAAGGAAGPIGAPRSADRHPEPFGPQNGAESRGSDDEGTRGL